VSVLFTGQVLKRLSVAAGELGHGKRSLSWGGIGRWAIYTKQVWTYDTDDPGTLKKKGVPTDQEFQADGQSVDKQKI
jgi:hypothetical protein